MTGSWSVVVGSSPIPVIIYIIIVTMFIKRKQLNFISRKFKKRKLKQKSVFLTGTFSKTLNYNFICTLFKNQYFKVRFFVLSSLFLEEIGTRFVINYWINLHLYKKY